MILITMITIVAVSYLIRYDLEGRNSTIRNKIDLVFDLFMKIFLGAIYLGVFYINYNIGLTITLFIVITNLYNIEIIAESIIRDINTIRKNGWL
jgi:F0F1-type ATP synthase membrane subunit a